MLFILLSIPAAPVLKTLVIWIMCILILYGGLNAANLILSIKAAPTKAFVQDNAFRIMAWITISSTVGLLLHVVSMDTDADVFIIILFFGYSMMIFTHFYSTTATAGCYLILT